MPGRHEVVAGESHDFESALRYIDGKRRRASECRRCREKWREGDEPRGAWCGASVPRVEEWEWEGVGLARVTLDRGDPDASGWPTFQWVVRFYPLGIEDAGGEIRWKGESTAIAPVGLNPDRILGILQGMGWALKCLTPHRLAVAQQAARSVDVVGNVIDLASMRARREQR